MAQPSSILFPVHLMLLWGARLLWAAFLSACIAFGLALMSLPMLGNALAVCGCLLALVAIFLLSVAAGVLGRCALLYAAAAVGAAWWLRGTPLPFSALLAPSLMYLRLRHHMQVATLYLSAQHFERASAESASAHGIDEP
jgi:hypothetical protein